MKHLKNLLPPVATMAILSLVLYPLATARKETATTASALRAIGLAATQYAADYNGGTVLTQQSDAASDRPWSVLLQPYVGYQAAPFFDPQRGFPTPLTEAQKAALSADPSANVTDAGATYHYAFGKVALPWYAVTPLSINDAGYSGVFTTIGGKCEGRRVGYLYGRRNLQTINDPSMRVAFAPTVYDGDHKALGYKFFHSYDASWIKPTVADSLFSWNNMVYNTKGLYPNRLIPVVHADGSAGVLNPAADFVDYTKASTPAKFCALYNAKVWGPWWRAE